MHSINLWTDKMKKNKKFYPSDKMRWNIYTKILRKIKLNKKDKILDAGCGQGILSEYLQGYNLYGIDFNKNSLILAKKRNYNQVKFSDINSIPYPDKFFDKTICIEVFQYISEPKKAYEELKRVTKNELIIAIPNYNCIGIRSILFKFWRKPFFETINKTYFPTNKEFLEELDKNVKIKYLSCRWGLIRNLFGNMLSSEVIGIYNLYK